MDYAAIEGERTLNFAIVRWSPWQCEMVIISEMGPPLLVLSGLYLKAKILTQILFDAKRFYYVGGLFSKLLIVHS